MIFWYTHEKQLQREMVMIPSVSVHPQHLPETELAMEVFHFSYRYPKLCSYPCPTLSV